MVESSTYDIQSVSKTWQYSLLLLRIALGILFLWSGLKKYMTGFSAEQYLLTSARGPFIAVFQSMAGNPIIDYLVVFGEIGIGLSMLLGVLVGLGSLSGMLMMTLFYFSVFPSKNGLVNDQFIYASLFLVFWRHKVGRFWGLDEFIRRTKFLEKFKLVDFLT